MAAALGVPAELVFKSLVTEVDGALTVAVVPVAGELDLKALAAAVGGKRATLADRVRQASQMLAAEGITLDVQERDGEFLLLGRSCPCQRLAEREIDVCSHDRKLLAALLKADVEPAKDSGGGFCAYVVREAGSGSNRS